MNALEIDEMLQGTFYSVYCNVVLNTISESGMRVIERERERERERRGGGGNTETRHSPTRSRHSKRKERKRKEQNVALNNDK